MNGATPMVSVIVPYYDHGDLLGESLRSIRRQAAGDVEVIVVDDGSHRSPGGVVTDVFPRARLIRQENRGPAAARNAGIRAAHGALIGFLDADDVWADGALRNMLEGLRNAPRAGAVHGHMRRFVSEGGERAKIGRLCLSFNLGSMLFRRNLFDRVGLFNGTLRFSEDVEFHLRMREAGARTLVIPDLTLLYRRHRASMTASRHPGARTPNHLASWMRLLSESMKRREGRGVGVEAASGEVAAATDLTVVIVVKNGAACLPEALESLRGQTLQPNEVLCIVGESKDGTVELLEREPGLRVLRQDGDGLAAARNQAIREAHGEVIAFLEHDDVWFPAKLEKQIRALRLLAVDGYSLTHFKRFEGERGRRAILDREGTLGRTPSALTAHRSVFDRVGGFDETLAMGCDSDWFARVAEARVPASVVGETLVYKRVRAGQASADWRVNRQQMFDIIARRRRREHGGA